MRQYSRGDRRTQLTLHFKQLSLNTVLTRFYLNIIGLLLILAGCGSQATGPPEPVLNSERIASVFGSYGVELLTQSAVERASCLYSVSAQQRTCRTLAVVMFAADADERLPGPMQRIRAGASLGATLQAAGWTVAKRNRWLADYDVDPTATPVVAGLLRLQRPERLALHVYDLDAVRSARRLQIATVIELHHPDYLDSADLRRIYRNLPTAVSSETERDRWLERLVAIPGGS